MWVQRWSSETNTEIDTRTPNIPERTTHANVTAHLDTTITQQGEFHQCGFSGCKIGSHKSEDIENKPTLITGSQDNLVLGKQRSNGYLKMDRRYLL